MKMRIISDLRCIAVAAALLCLAAVTPAVATTPQYQIYDIGVVDVGDTASQGFGVSHGGIAVGRSIHTGGSQAFTWTLQGGIVGLPNLAGRSYAVSNSANDSGDVVGTAATTLFGTSRLPVIWQNGVVSQLPLPAGETLGDANSVNASTVAVGSVDAGSLQRGAIYSGGSGTIITQTTANGSYFLTAFGINDSGRIVGQGIDPQNAARNVGIVYDIGQSMAFEVGALPRTEWRTCVRREQYRLRGWIEHAEPGLGSAVHLVGSRRNSRNPTRHGHQRRIRARGEFGRMGGGNRLLGFRDSVSL